MKFGVETGSKPDGGIMKIKEAWEKFGKISEEIASTEVVDPRHATLEKEQAKLAKIIYGV